MVTSSLKNIGRMVVAVLTVSLALGVIAAAAWGSTIDNPGWRACEEREGTGAKFKDAACSEALSEGHFEELPFEKAEESRALFWEAGGTEKLDLSHGAVVACKELGVGKGSEVIGGQPGKTELTLEYGGCEVEGHPKCAIDGREGGKAGITTNALDAELVYLSEKAAETHNAEDTGTLFKPATGEVLVTVDLEGECGELKGEYPLAGQVVAENVEGTKRARHHLIRAPEKPIGTYWINDAEGPVEHHVKLTSGGAEAIIILEGVALILPWGSGPTTHSFCWIIIFSSE